MKSILLPVLAVLFPLSAIAQEPAQPQPQRRVVLPPNSGNGASNRPVPANRTAPPNQNATSSHPEFPGLSQNVTVTLKGLLQGLVEVDLALTGCGPEFVTDYTLPTADHSDLPAPILSVQIVISETADGYHAQDSLGARVAQLSEGLQGPGGARNIEFRELVLRGSARLKPGKLLTLSTIGGKSLELRVALVE